MLQPTDRARVAETFGADDAQIVRDHFISHLLLGLAELEPTGAVFFGGTALARTHVPTSRLSEDIDLYAVDRAVVAQILTEQWPRTVRREYPRLVWDPPLTSVPDVEPALLRSPDDGIAVRVQLLKADATYQRWPTELTTIERRYADTAPVALRVPTRCAFVAMKAAAWRDRHAARDLFDLAQLASVGAIDSSAVQLLQDVTGTPLVSADLADLPRGLEWETQLGHQTRLTTNAATCLAAVRDQWAAAARW
jgi:Nucleotidyl transferase AbiEii toxin, Type IV TA system